MTNDITFDENKYKIKSRTILGQAEVPGMTRFLLRKGIVKGEKGAHVFLLGIASLFFAVAIYVFAVFVFDVEIGGAKGPTQEELQANRDRMEQGRLERRNNQNNATSN